jgi:hypothetical protein
MGLQCGILDNERKLDPAYFVDDIKDSLRVVKFKLNDNTYTCICILFRFLTPMKIMTLIGKVVPTNLVPAVAVTREGQVLFVLTGRKGHVDN